ncbi:hypothetical protein OVA24_15150 [Luteolibacter sp. SL250]|uniref:hypothetical protein n=1 Tax=Luteolibacter sp. SL250 TaxID=2995170 RepID=UPI00226D976E|nr:hypothetical protein [Luteolibacter sp. SL250]WAC18569.1 hypothetical protein OVA24_15150 [Luteolibacter sp. SL250]
MTPLRAILSVLLAAYALLLSSCIDGREEVWLEADGSGRAHFRYNIPATAAKFQGGTEGVEELLDSLLADFPGSTSEVLMDGDRLKIEVKLAFTSVEEISKVKSSIEGKRVPGSLEHLAGIFEVKREGLAVDFTRTVSPGKALPTAFIPSSEFRNRRLTYILHLPVVPQESTATRTENGGLTQIWDQPLSAAIRKPVVIHFKAKIPVPGWIIAAGAGLASVMAGGVLLVVRKMRRK